MRAKEVHATLNRELGPSMKAWGFERTGSATATWRQAVDPDGIDPRHMFVGTHIKQLGFDNHYGGWFTIELWVTASPDPTGPPIGRPATYYDFLSPLDKQRLLPMANQARTAIPVYQGIDPERELNTDALPYYSAGHVTAYAQAVRDMLPHIITVFAETRNFPPPIKVLEAL